MEENKNLLFALGLSDKEKQDLIDSGVFNSIIKGYAKMVVDGKGCIDELLDEVSAGEALAYLSN